MNDELRDLLEEVHQFIDGGCKDFERRMELCSRLYEVLRQGTI